VSDQESFQSKLRILSSVCSAYHGYRQRARGRNSTNPENSPLPDRPAAQRYSILARLLTWPKDEGEKEQADGKKKDEEDTDEQKAEPLESDRPDFTDSSTTVGYNRLQIESGYTYIHAPSGDSTADTHDLPELLLRYGVAERLELRFAWDEGMLFSRRTDTAGRVVTENGSSDLALGFKYALTKQRLWRPQSAMVVEVTAPVGSVAFSSRPNGRSAQLLCTVGTRQASFAELQHGQYVDK